MPNPLFGRFSQNGSSFIPGGGRNPMVNMMGMMQKYQQFKQAMGGDPEAARAEVQRLLDSGQMTQEQYNQLAQMAQQFQGMMHR